MSYVALYFALSAGMLVGALLTMGAAVVAADSPRWSTDLGIADTDLLPVAVAIGAFGLLIFTAAASAIIGAIGAA